MFLVIGPGVSKHCHNGMMPSVGRHALLTFIPVKPQYAAGSRTDPPVSLPVAQLANPLATATPEPEEDPPGTLGCSRSHGFRAFPCAHLFPILQERIRQFWFYQLQFHLPPVAASLLFRSHLKCVASFHKNHMW